jgi:hypothetical protein
LPNPLPTSSKNAALRALVDKYIFRLEAILLLPVNSGAHTAYQDFVVQNFCKYYPNPDSIARSTWDIIDRFWNLDLSFTDKLMQNKYSVFGPKPGTPSSIPNPLP